MFLLSNILNPNCGSRRVLDAIADKWTIITVCVLARGTRRFGQLQREIGGISQRMLTQTLRDLERDGIVKRSVYPVVPPRVEYSLTPLGDSLVEVLTAVSHWAEGISQRSSWRALAIAAIVSNDEA